MTNPAPIPPRERVVLQLTQDQQGWIVAALVAFLGVVFIGPAYTASVERGRVLRRKARHQMRRLGGGTIVPIRRRVRAWTR